MILSKLQDALTEVAANRLSLQRQLQELDSIELELRSMVSRLGGTVSFQQGEMLHTYAQLGHIDVGGSIIEERDRIDEIIDILRKAGRPMHIVAITEQLNKVTGKEVDRTQIEPGLNRHVQKAKKKRVDKFAPSTFGLPEWRAQPSLALIP